MGIMSFFLGVENVGLFLDSFLLFVIENHDTSLFLDLDGKPCLTTFGVKSRGYYGNGKSHLIVHSFKPLFLLTDAFYFIHVIILLLSILQYSSVLIWRVVTKVGFKLP